MSRLRPGTCGDPGPYDYHCTSHRLHDYSCYDAGEDTSWNDRSPEDWQTETPHQCDHPDCAGNLVVARFPRDIWAEVANERDRAHAKHGATSMESMSVDDPDGARRDIITEEWGEVAREYNEARHHGRPVDRAALRKELIQLAAMAGAWADALGEAKP